MTFLTSLFQSSWVDCLVGPLLSRECGRLWRAACMSSACACGGLVRIVLYMPPRLAETSTQLFPVWLACCDGQHASRFPCRQRITAPVAVLRCAIAWGFDAPGGFWSSEPTARLRCHAGFTVPCSFGGSYLTCCEATCHSLRGGTLLGSNPVTPSSLFAIGRPQHQLRVSLSSACTINKGSVVQHVFVCVRWTPPHVSPTDT